jgi:hypothetical protein
LNLYTLPQNQEKAKKERTTVYGGLCCLQT